MVALSGRTRDGHRWRLAPALVALVVEVNRRHPRRDTRSDGSIAAAAHSVANPSSDHEVDRTDGLVKALDLTDSPPEFDPDDFFLEVIRRRDPRVKYLIFDAQIWRSYRFRPSHPLVWTPEPYRGTNAHWNHAHLSVTDTGAADTTTWFPEEDDDMFTDDDRKLLNTVLVEQRKLRGRLDEIRRAETAELEAVHDNLADLIRDKH